jgi:hypothetical protein
MSWMVLAAGWAIFFLCIVAWGRKWLPEWQAWIVGVAAASAAGFVWRRLRRTVD